MPENATVFHDKENSRQIYLGNILILWVMSLNLNLLQIQFPMFRFYMKLYAMHFTMQNITFNIIILIALVLLYRS